MKRLYPIAVSMLLLSIAFPSILRAEGKDKPGKGPDHGKMQGMSPARSESYLERLTKQLKLTEAQQTSIKAAMAEQAEQMKTLYSEFSDKRKALQEGTEAKIMATLDKKQKAKYDEMQAEAKKKMEERRVEMQKRMEMNKQNAPAVPAAPAAAPTEKK